MAKVANLHGHTNPLLIPCSVLTQCMTKPIFLEQAPLSHIAPSSNVIRKTIQHIINSTDDNSHFRSKSSIGLNCALQNRHRYFKGCPVFPKINTIFGDLLKKQYPQRLHMLTISCAYLTGKDICSDPGTDCYRTQLPFLRILASEVANFMY